jgi:hypothetical protein
VKAQCEREQWTYIAVRGVPVRFKFYNCREPKMRMCAANFSPNEAICLGDFQKRPTRLGLTARVRSMHCVTKGVYQTSRGKTKRILWRVKCSKTSDA